MFVMASTASAGEVPEGDAAAGEAVYQQTCIACHGPRGEGTVPGSPDFRKADEVFAQSDATLLAHMRDGFQSGGGMAMPPKGGNPSLTEQDLMDALEYIRRELR
jgi:mono/diheme cytochrome c family protein